LVLTSVESPPAPPRSAAPHRNASAAFDLAGEQGPHVLLVDDDADILRIVQFYLKKQKYNVHTAASGEEALTILNGHPDIELVLSDVMMPGMSGLDLLKAIRAEPRTSDLSVVLISAEGQTAKKVAGLELGADDYITKPFNFDELQARVRNHIRLRRLQREVLQKNDLLRTKNEQFLRDLEAARNVQLALMPSKFPDLGTYCIGARYIPLEQVGGDFFDVVSLDGGAKIGLFIADVCGHGIAAAFVTAMTKISFRNACYGVSEPGAVLAQMNRELNAVLQGGFVTAFYAVFDVQRRSIRYASGGHPPVLVARRGEPKVIELSPQSTFLGAFPLMEYPETDFQCQPGDCLLFYTDGLLETRNEKRESYGSERLAKSLLANASRGVQELINLTVFELFEYMGSTPLEDDVTLLGVEIKG
jgi:serine phosphatase RsbU (regulator of sigma subunit)